MPRVVAFVPDLMFRSRIEAVAEASGVGVTFTREPAQTAAAVGEAPASGLVLVDLDSEGDPIGAVSAAKALAAAPRVIAFYSHVQVDVARRAQEAGADEVLPRSAFVKRLPAILASA